VLSFPRPGVTLALDFPILGEKTNRLIRDLDKLILSVFGGVYPAKDARSDVQLLFESNGARKKILNYADRSFRSDLFKRVFS